MIFSKGYVTILMTLVHTLTAYLPSSISYSPNFRPVTIPWSLYKRRLHFLLPHSIISLVDIFLFGNSFLWRRSI